MRSIIVLFIFLTNVIPFGISQSIYAPIGSRAVGLGDASITLSGFWSAFHNTAGICESENVEAGISYENKFGVPGFNFMAAGVTAPIYTGNIFLGAFRFGDELYNEHKVSLGYGTKVGIIKLGARVNYLQYQVLDFGTKNTYSIDFGGIATLTPQLLVGAQALNISQSAISKEDMQMVPTLLKFGISYRPKEYFMLNSEIEKDLQKQALIKVGAEYNFLEKFFLRSGIQNIEFQSFYGVGFKYLSLQWDYALSNHPELGLSHSISMQYAFRKK